MGIFGEIGKRLDDLECTIEQSNLKRREIASVIGDLHNEFQELNERVETLEKRPEASRVGSAGDRLHSADDRPQRPSYTMEDDKTPRNESRRDEPKETNTPQLSCY